MIGVATFLVATGFFLGGWAFGVWLCSKRRWCPLYLQHALDEWKHRLEEENAKRKQEKNASKKGNQRMKAKLSSIIAFLGALALQVAVVWQDANAPLADKLAATFVSGLALAITTAKLREIEQVLIAGCTIAATIATVILAHLSTGSKWATIGSVLLATIVQIRGLLSAQGVQRLGLTALLGLLLGLPSCSWWQKHKSEIDCAAIVSVQDAALLVTIVTQCAEIAVDTSAILPCIEGAAGSKWTSDVLKCFYAAQQGKAACPAYDKIAPSKPPRAKK